MSEQAWTKAPIGLQRFGNEIMVVGKHSDRPIILNAIRSGMHGATIRVRDKGIMRPITMEDEANHPDVSRWFSCVNALDGIPNPAEFVRAARELADIADGTIAFAANDLAVLPALTKAVKAFRAAGGVK